MHRQCGRQTCCRPDILQALNLIKAGYEVTVWNRTPEKSEALVKAGGHVRAAWPPVSHAARHTSLPSLHCCYRPAVRCFCRSASCGCRAFWIEALETEHRCARMAARKLDRIVLCEHS